MIPNQATLTISEEQLTALFQFSSLLQSSRLQRLLDTRSTRFEKVGKETLDKLRSAFVFQCNHRELIEGRGRNLEMSCEEYADRCQLNIKAQDKKFVVRRGTSTIQSAEALAITCRELNVATALSDDRKRHNSCFHFEQQTILFSFIEYAIALGTLLHDTGLPVYEKHLSELASDAYLAVGYPYDLLTHDRMTFHTQTITGWWANPDYCSTLIRTASTPDLAPSPGGIPMDTLFIDENVANGQVA